MSKDSINEMEQIQRGLEEFLEKEMQDYKKESNSGIKEDLNFTSGREFSRERKNPQKPRELHEIPIGRSNPPSRSNQAEPGNRSGRSNQSSRSNQAEPGNRSGRSNQSSRSNQAEPGNRSGRSNPPNRSEQAELGNIRTEQKNIRRDKKSRETEQENRRPQPGNKKSGQEGRRSAAKQEPETPMKKKKKKKKSRIKRFFTIVIVLVVLLGVLWYYLVGVCYQKLRYEEITALSGEPMKEEGVVNILLIGNDSRSQGEDGRSDAMILLSISDKTKTIYMTSLLRDMYVEIPGHKGNRLNAAYSYGGAELLLETLEKNLDISVNRYVLVNFQAFANLVDAVDGIELELTNDEVIYVNGYLVEYNILEGRAEGTDYMDTSLSGMVHLNGPQALAYCRNRYLGTDFGRTERQRKVLTEVFGKLPKAILTNPSELVDGLFPNLVTNLTEGECTQLSLIAWKLLSYDIIQSSIPFEGTYKNSSIRGMSVLEVDFDANKEYIRKEIYGDE